MKLNSGNTSTVSNSTAIVTSPCCGFDSEQRQNNTPQAITNFAGWGVCSISKLTLFNVGVQFMMIIPLITKTITSMVLLQKRVIATVATFLADNTPSSAKAPLRKTSDAAQTKNKPRRYTRMKCIRERQAIVAPDTKKTSWLIVEEIIKE